VTYERLSIATISHHSLDSVAEMVEVAASATVSNIVRKIGTETGLSVQTATWCIFPINVLLTGCQPFSDIVFLLASTSSTYLISPSNGSRVYLVYNTTVVQKQPAVRVAQNRATRAGLRTVCTMTLKAGSRPLSPSFFLTTNLSDSFVS
jgi:hypothetical protein